MTAGLLLLIVGCSSSTLGVGEQADSSRTPWLDLNFEQFESTEEFRQDRSVFGVENINADHVFLDEDVAYAPAKLTRSMRYEWTNQGPNTLTVGRGVRLPERVEELWVEIPVRFSRNYTPCNPAKPPCQHKLLFFQVPDGHERWDLNVGGAGEVGPNVSFTITAPFGKVEGQDWGTWDLVRSIRWLKYDLGRPYPPLETANPYFDEEWHVLRLHAKNSSSPEVFDARMRFWIDGRLIYDSKELSERYGGPRFATDADAPIMGVLIGRNKDKGRDEGTESVWFGRVRIWRDDPGW